MVQEDRLHKVLNMVTQRVGKFAVFVMLALFALLALVQSRHSSPVFEEPVTIATGYYELSMRDFALNPTHPALNFELSALPLRIAKPQLRALFSVQPCVEKKFWGCTEAFFSGLSRQGISVNWLFFVSRMFYVAIGVLLGLVVYLWARKLYGEAAALLALFLFSFHPVLISFSALALQNILAVFFVVLNAYLFWRLARSPSLRLLLLVGVTLGLALATEYTSFLLFGIYAPFFVVALFSKRRAFFERLFHGPPRMQFRVRSALLVALTLLASVFAVLLLSYQGQFVPLAQSVPQHYVDYAAEKLYPELPGPLSAVVPGFVGKVPVPFASYWSGFAFQYLRTTGEFKANFFAGHVYSGQSIARSLLYFSSSLFFKNPLPLLVLFCLGIYAIAGRRRLAAGEWIVVLLPLIFLAFFLGSSRNEGPAHILPVYVFMVLIASRAVVFYKHLVMKFAISALLVWYAAGAVLAAPHYLSYFNELLPEERAYGLFSDHSNDIGQELNHLRSYMADNRIERVNLSYFGGINPAQLGISYDYLPAPWFEAWIPLYTGSPLPEDCHPVKGVVAVSVTNLNGVHMLNQSCYSWLRRYVPVANLGGSILIYNLT